MKYFESIESIEYSLETILEEEKSIFAKFTESRRLPSGATAFISAKAKTVPHWNALYPGLGSKTFRKSDVETAQEFYQTNGIKGYILLTDNPWKKHSVNTVKYFSLTQDPDTYGGNIEMLRFSGEGSKLLDKFCRIIDDAYELSGESSTFFRQQMGTFIEMPGTHFYLARFNGAEVGSAALFKSAGGCEFLFNVAVLPSARRNNIAKEMLAAILSGARRPVLTYTNNPIMYEKILPSLGFIAAGTVYIVPIDRYLAEPT